VAIHEGYSAMLAAMRELGYDCDDLSHAVKLVDVFVEKSGCTLLSGPASREVPRPTGGDLSTAVILGNLAAEFALAKKSAAMTGEWDVLFARIFAADPDGFGSRAINACAVQGIVFPDYADPDGTFEDDVEAWHGALREAVAALDG
jgi:hypothetical protein